MKRNILLALLASLLVGIGTALYAVRGVWADPVDLGLDPGTGEVGGPASITIDAGEDYTGPRTLEEARRLVRRAELESARMAIETWAKTPPGPAQPEAARAALIHSEVARRLGLSEEALESARRATEVLPRNSQAHHVLARALVESSKTGGIAAAIRTLPEYKAEIGAAIQLDPENSDARAEEIALLAFLPKIAGGDRERAFELVDELLAYDPDTGTRMRATVLAADKQVDAAVVVCRSALDAGSADPLLRLTLARILDNDERTDEAAKYYDEALGMLAGEDYYEALYARAKLRVIAETELDQALVQLRAYADADPCGDLLAPVAGAHWRIGQIHALQGDDAAARTAYERALELDPDFDQARESLDEL